MTATSSTPRGKQVLQIIVVIVGACILFLGAAAVGRMSGGEDLDAAAAAGREQGSERGERAGARKGESSGEEEGAVDGRKAGYAESYRSSYKRAYAVSYRAAFRKAKAAEQKRVAAANARAAAARAAAACPAGSTIVAGRCFTPNYDSGTEVDPATESECGPGWHPVGVTGACAPDE